MTDAILCPDRNCDGLMISINPLDYDSKAQCQTCQKTMERKAVTKIEDELTSLIEGIDRSDGVELEICLNKVLKKVPESNYLALLVKRHLIYVWGRLEGYLMHQLPLHVVEK